MCKAKSQEAVKRKDMNQAKQKSENYAVQWVILQKVILRLLIEREMKGDHPLEPKIIRIFIIRFYKNRLLSTTQDKHILTLIFNASIVTLYFRINFIFLI